MPVRYPPEGKLPNGVRPRKDQRSQSRIVAYAEPERSFRRRFLRRLLSPPVIIPAVVLATLVVGFLVYYWTIFSGRIDNLLKGEVFTRSAGIYAAPKQLRVGQTLTQENLIEFLKHSGYVEKSQQADKARGRYLENGGTLDIEPSDNTTVDGQRQFLRVRVQFAKNGKAISALSELDNNTRLDKAWLEPELISSVTGRERAKRKIIGFNDIPPHLVKAITVTEDRSFFEHYGVNLRGILRALVRRYDTDPNSPIARQGGSSITQQLVKNLLLSPEKTLRRKVAEAYMSVILETRLSKEQIFALYCNQVYLGQQSGFSINGFGEAADAYFNKDVTNLTLPESAFLAGLIRSPNRYNPYHDLDTATARRNQVLDNMAETGAISAEEANQAKQTPLQVAATKGRIDVSDAPYFADYVQGQLGDIIAGPAAAEHLRIYTTIDLDLQRAAYAAVSKQLAALDKIEAKRFAPGTLQAALVAMNAKTGEIVAMVGGRDYAKSQLNRVSDALRQPGSAFKPFVYATALNTAYDPVPRVITPATTYMDEPKTFTFDNQEYSPGNFGDSYSHVPVTLRDALVHSLNVVTVDVAMEVTIGRVMNLAAKAGLPKPARAYPAMALGTSEATPLQVASAYTAFATLGTRTTPVAINRITTGNGVTIAAPTPQKNEVFRPDVAYVMTSFMKDVVNRGTAAPVRARGFKANVAGKTGTSRDGWFAGYTPNLVCVVWVGFDDGSQLGLTGANSALPIWTDFMGVALGEHPEWQGDWQMPAGIEQVAINPKTGAPAAADDPDKRIELFINGTSPQSNSTVVPESEVTPDTEQLPPLPPDEVLPPPVLEPSPGASPRTKPPKSELRTTENGRLEGTITLDIDPTTGLIAVESCPVIRTKTFVLGTEPKKYCGPEYHQRPTASPRPSRPGLTIP
ncbi:MAG TPA: penicillin-binding protein [Blastocatellia bacterium]|nr:penicillin-binding protein [Blastocatellia bacterium]HCX30434.1 penicillin-binding protein [Blastocatellia bacterium]